MEKVKKDILNILEELKEEEFKGFKWNLKIHRIPEDQRVIRPCDLENADRMDTVDLMVRCYDTDSVQVAVKVLEEMQKNDLAQKISETSSTGELNPGGGDGGPGEETTADKPAKKTASKAKKCSGQELVNSDLIEETVAASRERSGVSAAAVKKALTAGGYDVDMACVKTAIKSRVVKGTLVQVKGKVKMSKTTADKPAKKAAPQAKKPTAKKVKKAPAAKKAPAKKAARSPKKAVKKAPAAKKAPAKKAARSPKKAVKKAPAAKKAPAKKAAKPKAKKAAPKKK